MTLSTAAQKDLHKLAVKRVEAAMNSVIQLLDDDQQTMHLSLNVLSNLTEAAAHHMHETTMKPDGTQPSMGECFCRVLSMLAALHGLDSKVVTEDEAKQMGVTTTCS
jgi:hypothetical protein